MSQQILFDRTLVRRGDLHAIPVTLREAQEFVLQSHRHNRPPRGCLVSAGVADASNVIRGVMTIGRPNARAYDDGLTAEVTRTCVINCRNANSFLYGLARKLSTLLGYTRLITYTREDESGYSLKAAGFKMVAVRKPRKNWANSSVKMNHLRAKDEEQFVTRYLWEVRL